LIVGRGWEAGTQVPRNIHKALILFAFILGAQASHADTLKSAVRAAVTSNPSLKAASEEARASAFDLLKLESEYLPTVTARAEAGFESVDDVASLGATSGDTLFTSEVGVDVELVLFDGHRRSNLVYSDAARVDGNILRLLDASETMALNAVEVYIDLYRHLLLQHAAEHNLQRHRAILRSVNEQVSAGRAPLSDRLSAQNQLRAAELVLLDVRRAGLDAEARYERIVGKKRKGSLTVPRVKVSVGSKEALIDAAVRNSNRVRGAGTEIDRARYNIGVVESGKQPRVSLNAGARYGDNVDGVRGHESDAFVGMRMTWDIFRGGREAERSAAIARESKARAEQHEAVRAVREMAARTWNSYQINTERAVLLDIQFNVNSQIVRQFREEFEAGKRSLLEVLDAERARFDVEFEKISADASLAFSTYRLLASQSRLAKHFGVQPAGAVLVPDFQQRALANPRGVFKTTIPSLD
jgi:adhesin transport system outer membrane protein